MFRSLLCFQVEALDFLVSYIAQVSYLVLSNCILIHLLRKLRFLHSLQFQPHQFFLYPRMKCSCYIVFLPHLGLWHSSRILIISDFLIYLSNGDSNVLYYFIQNNIFPKFWGYILVSYFHRLHVYYV